MAELRLSDEAAGDLDDIRTSGIERFGQLAADHHLAALRQAIALLRDYPFAGQARPEFRRDIRSITRPPHRILYTATPELVIIVRVLHQARDVTAALNDVS
jgi:toxin ParE1/3/4